MVPYWTPIVATHGYSLHADFHSRTTDLVQKLKQARRDLLLERAIETHDTFNLLILDDLANVTKDQAKTSIQIAPVHARFINLCPDAPVLYRLGVCRAPAREAGVGARAGTL